MGGARPRPLCTGDSAAHYNIYYQGGLGHHSPFKVFVASLRKLEALGSAVSEVLPAHGETPIGFDVIPETIAAVFDLVANHEGDERRESMIGPANVHTFGNALILYGDDVLDEALKHGLE